MRTTKTSAIHAILIGIDYYKPNRLYKNLTGAVRDINLVETFLKNTLKIPAERIHKLVSPHLEDIGLLTKRSAQNPDPTYENIVNIFRQITATAQPGEQVYIHYSGHGGRAKTVYPNLKQGSTDQFDEGIVPMDIGDTEGGRYLRDVEMTTLLKRMTDKGLIVTVVLDSCHAGGSTKGDAEIRSSAEPDLLERTDQSLVAKRDELERNWLELTRDRTVRVAGLPQSRDYVLLAACRDNELAYEYAVNGGTERHGALTYWMIDTLTSMANRKQALTYKLLHDRVNAQIQSKFESQTPMIVGESDRFVFGNDQWSTPFTVSVITVNRDQTQVTLNAGQAQGLSQGTRFSIYLLNTTDFSDPSGQVAIAEVTRSNASESIAKVLKPAEGGIATQDPPEPGAPAILLSAPVNLIQRVRFWDENIASHQREALNKVRQALAGQGWVVEVTEDRSAQFQVAIDQTGHYEICQNGIAIKNLRPLLEIDDSTAPKQIINRLVHLAKYQAVQSLNNSDSKLAEEIEVELLKNDETAFDDPQNPVVQNGEIVRLRLTNRGNHTLKIAVLDLEPTWAISQIPIGGLESPFFNLSSGAIVETPLRMSIPDDITYQQTRETLKVFAVREGLADFRWLILPPLDKPLVSRSAELESALAEFVKRSVGEPEGVNPLNNLLKMIGADWEQAPNVFRAATVVVDPKQDWMTKQVRILVRR